MNTLLLLGSGELGREVAIAAKRLGYRVVACDSYHGAPAMHVADESFVFSMLDGKALRRVVELVQPFRIVPEIEAIRTEVLIELERDGYHVVPCARATNITMNRKAIRNLVAHELGLTTAPFQYASTKEQFVTAVELIGLPCVVKPLMSSSGKGQSTVRHHDAIDQAWHYAMEGSRGDATEVIVEGYVAFESEITLLTITQQDAATVFAPPIGHRQERGDYQESWMPHIMPHHLLLKAQTMAEKITRTLGGFGLWGVEFFLTNNDVIFSELSPRPHDTGLVTLSGCIELNEFELHVRAMLGLPIPQLPVQRCAASAVILASPNPPEGTPVASGLERALVVPNTTVHLFGKPSMRPYRRMGVATSWCCEHDDDSINIAQAREQARRAASMILFETR
jgi:phosphoribosylglycinamide formyltransferase 2